MVSRGDYLDTDGDSGEDESYEDFYLLDSSTPSFQDTTTSYVVEGVVYP